MAKKTQAKPADPQAAPSVQLDPFMLAGRQIDFLSLWGATGDVENEHRISAENPPAGPFFAALARRYEQFVGEPTDAIDAYEIYAAAYRYHDDLKKKREARRKWLFGTGSTPSA